MSASQCILLHPRGIQSQLTPEALNSNHAWTGLQNQETSSTPQILNNILQPSLQGAIPSTPSTPPPHYTLHLVLTYEMDCCCLVAQSCLTIFTPWTAACQASLSFTISQSLLKLMSIEPIQPSHPLSPHFSSCPQSFPASGSFPKSQLFASGDHQVTGASASASVLPVDIQC